MRRAGFTFIELITVWAIMAILAAILFPVFAKAQEKGRQCSCVSNLQNIGTALKIYACDNWGHLPPADNYLMPLVPKYLPEPAALFCPTLRKKKPVDFPPPLPEEVMAGKQGSDYVYRGGLCDDDNPLVLVAADEFEDLHNGGDNCLWLDGHAKWLSRNWNTRPPSGQPRYPTGWGIVGWEEIQRLRQAKTGRTYLSPPEEQSPPEQQEGGGPRPRK